MSQREYHVRRDAGHTYDLGVAEMRLLASAQQTGQKFALAEFSGGPGPWTLPHIHRETQESFFILTGNFTFTLDAETIEADVGDYVRVPLATPHTFAAGPDGGSLLVLFVPGGLEDMFIELAQLSHGRHPGEPTHILCQPASLLRNLTPRRHARPGLAAVRLNGRCRIGHEP